MTGQALTRLLTSIALVGLLGAALQAGTADGAPQEKAASSAGKSKDKAAKSKAAPATTKAATGKDKAAKPAANKAAPKPAANKAAPKPATTKAAPKPASPPSAPALPPGELATLKEAVAAARKGRSEHAVELKKSISDPVARKLVEWAILRSDDNDSMDFTRYVAFVAENPSWPAIGMLRRRAEATLWSDRRDPAFVRSFFSKDQPTTSKGRFALARALLLQGDRAGAQRLVRATWRNDNFPGELEATALDVFGDLITAADHKARMDMRLYAEDAEGAMRSAHRAGGHAEAIAKARIAVINKAPNANALLDALPAETRRDIGVIFSRVQWLRRNENEAEFSRARFSAFPTIPARPSIPTSGGSSAAWSRASCSTSATPRPPIGSPALRYCRAGKTIAWKASSPPAGSRYASSTMRKPRWRILPSSVTATATRSRWRAPVIGRAVLPRHWAGPRRRAHITKRLHAIRPPITASSRARGSAIRTSCCGRCPKPHRTATSPRGTRWCA